MKKIISLCLIAVMLFSVSCSQKISETDMQNSDASVTEAATEEQAKEYAASYLPDKNYDGYEFRMITVTAGTYDLILAANVAEESGEVISDAVYRRNRKIEDRYNIKFTEIDKSNYEELTKTFKNSAMANSDDFDLCLLIMRDAFSLAVSGLVLPTDQLPYVDKTQPWYAKNINSQLTIANKQFFAYSDECINMFEQSLCVTFNKRIQEECNIEDIYSLVKNGKWIIDTYFAFSKAAVRDLNGDGKMTDEDQFGTITECDMYYPCFWVGSGIYTVDKDEDDNPYFSAVGNDRFFALLEKVLNSVNDGSNHVFDAFVNKFTVYQSAGGEDNRRTASKMFADGKGLFRVAHIGTLKNFRNMSDEFGVVPIPKYDEAQAEYKTRVIDGWINTVSVSAPDPERTSIILEALAVESKNFTVPAYYEIALKEKYSRDEATKEMMDLIYNTRTMDLGDTVWMNPIRDTYIPLFTGKKNNFASATESSLKKIQKVIDTAIQEANKLS